MYLFFLLLGYLACYKEEVAAIKDKMKRLQTRTNASTHYDFINLSSRSSEGEIKAEFRKLWRASAPAGLTEADYKELLTDAFNLLTHRRDEYDNFLRDSKYIYIDEPANYRNHIIVLSIAAVCLLVCVDFVVYAFRYLKYTESLERQKKAKKGEIQEKPSKKSGRIVPPLMLSQRIVKNVSRVFNRRQ